VACAVAHGTMHFSHGGTDLSVKLADEAFPPYEKVIPQSHARRVVVSRDALTDAVRRCEIVAAHAGGVRIELVSGALTVRSESPEVGDMSETLDVDYAGEPLTIGFNAKYLLDAIGAAGGDDLALELNESLDPGVVRPAIGDGFVGVVMPMRV